MNVEPVTRRVGRGQANLPPAPAVAPRRERLDVRLRTALAVGGVLLSAASIVAVAVFDALAVTSRSAGWGQPSRAVWLSTFGAAGVSLLVASIVVLGRHEPLARLARVEAAMLSAVNAVVALSGRLNHDLPGWLVILHAILAVVFVGLATSGAHLGWGRRSTA